MLIDKDRLLTLIPTGRENAISRPELAEILRVDVRTVSAIIAEARRQKALICSGNEGYYQPSDNAELKRFYKRMHRQSLSMLTVLKEARKALKAQGDKI